MSTATLRRVVLAVALVAFAAALAGVDARATYGARVTADEPQYLLTAQSLAEDRSLDISDEIAERAYAPYHEVTIDRQTRVLEGGREVSPHDPLLPVLIAPAVSIGGWVGAKLTLAVLGAATAALAVWLAIRRFGVGAPSAAVAIGATFVGLPLSAYGTQVYPELPAALVVLVAFAAISAPRVDRREWAVATLAIVALPWLAVKYAPVAAVLAVGLLASLGTTRRRMAATGWLTLAGAAYLALHRLWYGGWTVYATGDHFEDTGEFSVVGTQADPVGRSRRIVGLLVDRDFGLAAWSPVWLLLPIAVVLIVRHRPHHGQLWLAVVLAGWSNATFVALTMHGWWIPGRQVVVVLPLAAVGIAWLVDRIRWLVPATAVAGVLGAANWLWLSWEASTGRRTLVVDFMETTALPYRLWSLALPSGIDATPADTIALTAWGLGLTIAAAAAWRSGVSDRPTPAPASPAARPR